MSAKQHDVPRRDVEIVACFVELVDARSTGDRVAFDRAKKNLLRLGVDVRLKAPPDIRLGRALRFRGRRKQEPAPTRTSTSKRRRER